MNINRFNYEEFFLLYVDDELSAAERKQVEAFVQENPDLEEELMMLKQSQLRPDTSVVLEDKSSLFKSENQTLINIENYETFFLLYVDEELSAEKRRAVELFASQHPAQQQELDILMQTKITPETSVVFPDKAVLYKKVESGKVVAFKVWRIVAVAAMLILALGIFWLNSDNGTNSGPGLAKKDNGNNEKKDPMVAARTNESSSKTDGSSNPKTTSDENITKENQEQGIAQVKERETKKKSNGQIDREVVKTPESVEHLSEGGIMSNPEEGRRIVTAAELLAKEDVEVNRTLATNLDSKVIVIEQAQQRDDVVLTGEDAPSDELAVGPIQTKNRVRGIFRQVARVVEKNTHVSAGENKKLRIGNIQIALK